MSFTKFIKHIIKNYVFETLLYSLSYVKYKIKDIDDQNTMYVFASEDTHDTYLNIDLR